MPRPCWPRCCSASSGWTPNWLLDQFGTAFFWVSLVIIFVECGLFFPFLPGDTLLVAMGLFIAGEKISIIPGGPFVNLSSRWCC